MKFYFDESGRFTLPNNPLQHRAAVVVGVAVSELIEDELRQGFQEFVAGLSDDEKNEGEPKGRLLKLRSRSDFCDLLAGIDGVQLTPVTLDMNVLGESPRLMAKELGEHIAGRAGLCVHESMRNALQILSKKVTELSYAQMWRLYAWANAFREALSHAVVFLSNRGHAESWNKARFEVDMVQPDKEGMENSVFRDIILGWLESWSRWKPLVCIEEIHTAEHPFVKNFDSGKGIDISKLIGGNIHFVDSGESWGVQIADIAANIVFRALHDLQNKNGGLFVFSSLMRSSPYDATRGAGFLGPFGEPAIDYSKKYCGLVESLRRRGPMHL